MRVQRGSYFWALIELFISLFSFLPVAASFDFGIKSPSFLSVFFSTQNACPRLSVYRSPRSSPMTERTGSVRTAIVRTIRKERSTRTPPTSSRPFYRSVISQLKLRDKTFSVNCPICPSLTLGRSVLQFATKRPSNKELSSSNSSLSSTSETANESTSPNTPEAAPRARRRVRQNDIITTSELQIKGHRCFCVLHKRVRSECNA